MINSLKPMCHASTPKLGCDESPMMKPGRCDRFDNRSAKLEQALQRLLKEFPELKNILRDELRKPGDSFPKGTPNPEIFGMIR